MPNKRSCVDVEGSSCCVAWIIVGKLRGLTRRHFDFNDHCAAVKEYVPHLFSMFFLFKSFSPYLKNAKIIFTCPISENVRQLQTTLPLWMVAFNPTCNRRLIPTSIRGRQQKDVHVHQADGGHPRHHPNVPRLVDNEGNMHPHLLLGKGARR